MIRIDGAVLCAGNLTEDILVWHADQVDFTATTWVTDVIRAPGGNGANTTSAIARLGGKARLTGLVGDDDAGEHVIQQLRDAGVDVCVDRCELPTPVTVIIIRSDAARGMLHRPGASREAFNEPLEFTPNLIAGCAHFHLANPFSMPKVRPQAAQMLERARAAGLSTSLDAGWDTRGEWFQLIGPCLPHLDLLFVNEDESEQLSGSQDPRVAGAYFREHGVGATVVKLGAKGCLVFDGDNGCVEVAGFPVHAVDTTGAGDCFAGGYLAGLQRSMTGIEAARLANAVGALTVQRPGATVGLLDYEATLRWMASRNHNGHHPILSHE